MPSSTEGPNGTGMTFYKFKMESGVIEPTEELAPVPANVSCGKVISELKEGCRALKFEYDEGATTAKGEKATEWGEFTKHLSRVRYIAWNSSKTKEEPVVAEDAYDVQGQLRAVWNPQIKPELKTIYGYDAEGHVTALSTAGHEPELLEQGTIPGETNLGRLLAVAVPSAGTALGSGEAPGIKEVPTLSSTKPVVGTKISVNLVGEKEKTPGTWTANPLAFIYQWEDCNTKDEECSPIAGAVNQAYYPTASDEGHELVAQVRALNATGATTASTAEKTSTVAKGTPNTPLPEPPSVGSDAVTTLEYQVPVSGSGAPYEMTPKELATWGQTDDPSEQAMAIFPPEKVMGWPAKEYKNTGETVYYLDGKDRAVNTALPTGGISTTEYNLYNDITRTLTPDNRLKAIAEGCKAGEECKSSTENTYEEKGTEPGTELLSTLGPQHTVELAVGKEGKPNEEALARERTNYSYNEGAPAEGGPYHLVTKTVDSAETAAKEGFDPRTTETLYSGQGGLGWKLHKPTSVITDPSGLDLVHTTEYNSGTGGVIETKMPEGSPGSVVPPAFSSSFGAKGKENGQFEFPTLAAVTSTGDIWVVDSTENRLQEFNEKGEYQTQFGSAGTGDGQFKFPFGIAVEPSTGDIVVADREQARIQEFSSTGTFIRAFGYGVSNGESKFEICTSECHAGVGGSGEGQLYRPDGITLDSSGNIWTVDENDDRVEEYNEKGERLQQFGIKGSEPGQIAEPVDIAYDNGNLYITEAKNQRVQEFSTSGSYITGFGSEGTGNGQFNIPYAITAGPKSGNLYVTDRENNRVEEFTSAGRFATTFGIKGKGNGEIEAPTGIVATGNETVYVTDHYNERVQKWTPATQAAHDTKTIYYTTAANSEYEVCGKQFAMANLPCETVPAAQPGTSELPELPTTKYTYNVWNEPETAVETVGSTTRTKTNTYDEAGRPKTAAISSTTGEPFPTVTDEYNKETGALEKQCTNSGKPCTEGKPKTITSIDNRLGQLESYTDADENTTTLEYEKEKGDRLKTINDQEGTEAFEYNETSGLLDELTYTNGTSTKMTFGATYDIEGNMLTESYPNGMTAAYTYNQVDKPTSLVYKKTTNCTEEEKEKCKWFKDTVIPSIHGQWLEQTSTLSHQADGYDPAGRLTQVQNTPTGGKCTTRIYAYDEDTNRTSLTTREPTAEGKCATTGGKVQAHAYDPADRLTDPGIAYNPFGDITTLPANDAEEAGSHPLTNTYYTDNQVASQTQGEQTVGYKLDPAGRTLETISTGKPNNSTVVSHYAGPGNTPAWTITPVSGEWRRNITGINGSLVAIQNNGETPELQLTDLHGDIIAKAYLSETATGLAAEADTSEYGVPTVTAPAKYSWLGAIELPTELPSGVTTMGARSYVPQIGRFLQPDPVPGGSANAYSYTFGDPVNTTDPTGDYTNNGSIALEQALSNEAQAAAAARQAAAEAAARAAAEKAAREAAEAAAAAAGPQYAGGEEWGEGAEEWEEWEEEGEYEYISDHGGESGKEEHHIESGVLYRPLGGKAVAAGTSGATMPLCEAVAEGPCARLVPDDHSPNIQSQCNRTGQDCSGHRGSRRRPSGNSPGERAAIRCVMGAGLGADGGPLGAVAGCVVGAVWEY